MRLIFIVLMTSVSGYPNPVQLTHCNYDDGCSRIIAKVVVSDLFPSPVPVFPSPVPMFPSDFDDSSAVARTIEEKEARHVTKSYVENMINCFDNAQTFRSFACCFYRKPLWNTRISSSQVGCLFNYSTIINNYSNWKFVTDPKEKLHPQSRLASFLFLRHSVERPKPWDLFLRRNRRSA